MTFKEDYVCLRCYQEFVILRKDGEDKLNPYSVQCPLCGGWISTLKRKGVTMMLSEAISKKRIEEGLTQQSVGKDIGIPQTVVSKLERGRKCIAAHVKKAAEWAGVPLEEAAGQIWSKRLPKRKKLYKRKIVVRRNIVRKKPVMSKVQEAQLFFFGNIQDKRFAVVDLELRRVVASF